LIVECAQVAGCVVEGSLPAPVDVLPASVRRDCLRRRLVVGCDASVRLLRRPASSARPSPPRLPPTPPSAPAPRQQVGPDAAGDGEVPGPGGRRRVLLSTVSTAVRRRPRQRAHRHRTQPRLPLAARRNVGPPTTVVPGQQTHLVLTEPFRDRYGTVYLNSCCLWWLGITRGHRQCHHSRENTRRPIVTDPPGRIM